MEWPAKEDLKPAPPTFVALEGYPGVFICVEVGVVVCGGVVCGAGTSATIGVLVALCRKNCCE